MISLNEIYSTIKKKLGMSDRRMDSTYQVIKE
jgi:hypothetical protein